MNTRAAQIVIQFALTFGVALIGATFAVTNIDFSGHNSLWGPADSAVQAERAKHAVNAPSVENFEGKMPAGCTQTAPELGDLAVVRMDGTVERMDFAEVAERGESKNRADDVWVVGTCS